MAQVLGEETFKTLARKNDFCLLSLTMGKPTTDSNRKHINPLRFDIFLINISIYFDSVNQLDGLLILKEIYAR